MVGIADFIKQRKVILRDQSQNAPSQFDQSFAFGALEEYAVLTENLLGTAKQGGMTYAELEIMHHMVLAWNGFVALDPSQQDSAEFRQALHVIQSLLGRRVLSRLYPEVWSGDQK